MSSLATRLQCFRLTNGWSKRVLAEKLGVSIPSIIRWETEAAEPNDYNRYKIERLLTAERPIQPLTLPRRRIVQLSLFANRIGEIGRLR